MRLVRRVLILRIVLIGLLKVCVMMGGCLVVLGLHRLVILFNRCLLLMNVGKVLCLGLVVNGMVFGLLNFM